MKVPCGHCITCRQKRSRSWQFRLIKEAEHTVTHKVNGKLSPRILFLTLTFNDENLPKVPSNDKERDVVAPYIKSWRENWRRAFGVSPRYFAITDLGTESARLHIHILLFDPRRKDGSMIGRSTFYKFHRVKGESKPPRLRENCYWKYGFCTYCEWLKGLEGIHYASGYMTCANAEKKAKKHKKSLHPLARKHFASIFVSQGLGKSFIFTNTFATLRAMKSGICKCGKYTYALPRYYKLFFFDDIEYFEDSVDVTTGEMLKICHILPRSEQLRALNYSLIDRRRLRHESQRSIQPIYIGDTPYNPFGINYERVVANRLRMYYDNCFDYHRPSMNIDWRINKPTYKQLTLWQTTKTAPQVSYARTKPLESTVIGTTAYTAIPLRSQLVEWYQLCASFCKVTQL